MHVFGSGVFFFFLLGGHWSREIFIISKSIDARATLVKHFPFKLRHVFLRKG
jgi:hypothetical protein